jgi:ATP-binding cassette subfamily F protein 3
MAIATLTNLEKSFGQRTLLDDVNLSIERGERVGLIGANGSGKTTLFKLLAGQLESDGGTIALADGVKVGYLAQDPTFIAGSTVLDEAELAFASLHDLAHRLRDLEHAMAAQQGDDLQRTLNRYQNLQHEFDLAGGYVWHHRLEATLLGVGLERQAWEQKVETLSGGQRSRLALAQLLINEPDLLLLDEPTNHLDLAAIEWVENYLLAFKGAVLLISHDRFLLDRVATRIVWLTQAKLKSYPGNYSAFVKQREVEELSQQRAYEQQQAMIEKQQEFIRRFGAGQRSKEAKGREKRLNRFLQSDAVVQQVESAKKLHLKFGTDQRAGDRVLSVRNLSKSFPANGSPAAEGSRAAGSARVLWENLTFDLKRGERIGIIGPNGSGKTTLLRTLLGDEDADDGEVRWGANLNIGYYDQRLDDFDAETTILDEVRDGRVHIPWQQIRDTLGLMLFSGDDAEKRLGMLSGGERARVRLAQLLLDRPNVLVLDEPTNHLDISASEALETALRNFQGTLICVSHDRWFLDRLISRLFVLRPPGMVDFAGNYSRWQEKVVATDATASAKPQAERAHSSPTIRKSNPDNPYLRPFGRLTVQELEAQISETEIALAQCQQDLTESYKDPGMGRQLQLEMKELSEKLSQLEAEYFTREA